MDLKSLIVTTCLSNNIINNFVKIIECIYFNRGFEHQQSFLNVS